jgi:glutaminyl-tRNA synthetase
VGLTKYPSLSDISLLEYCIRDELNRTAPRVMGVLDPLRLVIENYPDGRSEEVEAINNPEDPAAGTRRVPFSKALYIERDDFRPEAPKNYYRLTPGREVRLRYGYLVTCTGFTRDPDSGQVSEVRCSYDPASRGGDAPDGRKVKGTIHWVSAAHALRSEVRLYDRLFSVERPDDVPEGVDWKSSLNPHSLEIRSAMVEPSLATAEPGARFQFERKGYFCVDHRHSRPGAPVFNQIVSLRDSWAKAEKGSGGGDPGAGR